MIPHEMDGTLDDAAHHGDRRLVPAALVAALVLTVAVVLGLFALGPSPARWAAAVDPAQLTTSPRPGDSVSPPDGSPQPAAATTPPPVAPTPPPVAPTPPPVAPTPVPTDVAGRDPADLPRHPGSVRLNFERGVDGTVRWQLIRYRTNDTVDAVREHYRQALRTYRWLVGDAQFGNGGWVFRANRGTRELTLEISGGPSTTEVSVYLSNTRAPAPVGDDGDDGDDGDEGDEGDD